MKFKWVHQFLIRKKEMKWFSSVKWREATQNLPAIDGIKTALIYIILDLSTGKLWCQRTEATTHVQLTTLQVHLDYHNLFRFMFDVSVKTSRIAFLSLQLPFDSITHWNNCELPDGPRKPKINPTPFEVKVGNSLTMYCNTTADPVPTSYTWYSHTGGTDKVLSTGNVLYLTGLQRGDEACYTCSATNIIKTGQRSDEACVQVLCK